VSRITITINCANAAEARDVFAALAGAPAPVEVGSGIPDTIAAPAPAPASAPAPAAAPTAEPAAPPPLDEAIETLKAFGRERGAVTLKTVLEQLGVRRATEIRPEQVSDLMAAMDGAAG
jgi:hypothetical protein